MNCPICNKVTRDDGEKENVVEFRRTSHILQFKTPLHFFYCEDCKHSFSMLLGPMKFNYVDSDMMIEAILIHAQGLNLLDGKTE